MFVADPYIKLLLFNCCTIPNVYPTVDFDAKVSPWIPFDTQRRFAPKGPLVNDRKQRMLLTWFMLKSSHHISFIG